MEYFLAGYDIDVESLKANKLSINQNLNPFTFKSNKITKSFSISSFSTTKSNYFKHFSFTNKEILLKSENHTTDLELKRLAQEINKATLGSPQVDLLINEFTDNILVVVINKNDSSLILYTDRFGLFPTYYAILDKRLIFSNDIKVFRCLEGFTTRIDPNAIRCFIYSGQLIGNITWFENISHASAKSRLRFDFNELRLTSSNYWSWSHIKEQKTSLKEAVKNTTDLLRSSVTKRISKVNGNSIFLSGGRDSSAILLSQEHNVFKSSYSLLTKEDYKSSIIVDRLTKKKNVESVLLVKEKLKESSYQEEIWNLSCAISSLHLHFAPYKHLFDKKLNYFNGIPGDLNLGGSFLMSNYKRISRSVAISHPIHFCHYLPEYVGFIDNAFYDFKTEDPFYLDTRIKRFTLRGMNYMNLNNQSYPFHDLNLNDYIYSLEVDYLKNRKLYNLVLEQLGYFSLIKRNYYRSFLARIKSLPTILQKPQWQKDSPTILDFIKKNDLVFNSIVPPSFIKKRIETFESWLQLLSL